MSLWVIVPAKEPWRAKSRLAGVLTQSRRWSLSMQLLERTLIAVRDATVIDRCIVISKAAPHLAMARVYGMIAVSELRAGRAEGPAEAEPAREVGADPLNAALRQAAEVAVRGGATGLLILHADLVRINAGAIDEMVRAVPDGPAVVLAPDHGHRGTNALLMRPPSVIPFLFGPDSFAAHRHMADLLGIPLVVHDSPALAEDLDTPDDLTLLNLLDAPTSRSTRGTGRARRSNPIEKAARRRSEQSVRSTTLV
jgi:2-phospho-L-lactate/phosphoenolpyruvate guanylyltransferase